jgi:hypothetical protein
MTNRWARVRAYPEPAATEFCRDAVRFSPSEPHLNVVAASTKNFIAKNARRHDATEGSRASVGDEASDWRAAPTAKQWLLAPDAHAFMLVTPAC